MLLSLLEVMVSVQMDRVQEMDAPNNERFVLKACNAWTDGGRERERERNKWKADKDTVSVTAAGLQNETGMRMGD